MVTPFGDDVGMFGTDTMDLEHKFTTCMARPTRQNLDEFCGQVTNENKRVGLGCTVLSLGAPSSVWVHRPLFVLRAGRGIAYMQGHTVHAVMSRDQLLQPPDLLKCPDPHPEKMYYICTV